MITASLLPRHTSPGVPSSGIPRGTWQRDLAAGFSSPEDLLAELGLDGALLSPAARAAHARFRLRVPRSYVRRMRHGDPADPLLRQVLPLDAELIEAPGFEPDPLHERAAELVPGLLQKYHGRALLVTTGACAIHCRYCFRREFPYADHVSGPNLEAALAAIGADPSIEEVILSGGDPLSLTDARLAAITHALARLPTVRRLRLHTRQPIVLPSRVDEGLIDWLSQLSLSTVIVLHANHPAELDTEVAAALARLRATGATLLNQSVLLKGVNDDAAVLAALSQRLFETGVLPYYLHALDPVRGAAHFDVPETTARHLMATLGARLPGYLVPRLVREVPGATAKVSLGSLPVM
jgi:EF-P beta-lysylation protein EpmB